VVDKKSKKVIISDNDFVPPSFELSKKQISALTKAGYYKDGKVLKFFNDLIPSEELMLEMTVDMLQGLNSRGSRGNIFPLNPNPSDWAVSARTTAAAPEAIEDVKYLSKINNVLNWVSEYITGNDAALPSDFKWGNRPSDMSFVPLYIDNKGQSFDKTQKDLVLIDDILNGDSKLKKLFKITTEFQTYSQYSNDYSTITFKLLPTGEYEDKDNKSTRATYGHLVF
jgi:hypothetical protein